MENVGQTTKELGVVIRGRNHRFESWLLLGRVWWLNAGAETTVQRWQKRVTSRQPAGLVPAPTNVCSSAWTAGKGPGLGEHGQLASGASCSRNQTNHYQFTLTFCLRTIDSTPGRKRTEMNTYCVLGARPCMCFIQSGLQLFLTPLSVKYFEYVPSLYIQIINKRYTRHWTSVCITEYAWSGHLKQIICRWSKQISIKN